jgi:pimeloyl-ACP methyl ester carboxylesterase
MKRIVVAVLGLCSLSSLLFGQVHRWDQPLPLRANLPVILVTGHDAVCPSEESGEIPFYELTFGTLHNVLATNNRTVLHFNVCAPGARPQIEEIAARLARMVDQLRFEDGTPVQQVDMVAHSMGGLVARAWLSGKQANGAPFAEPVSRVRKLIFAGTPHMGTPVAFAFDGDPQLQQMSPGSRFLFDLASWNRSAIEFAGVEMIAVAGTAGISDPDEFNDSVVSLTSAAPWFLRRESVRVLPACHTFGGIGALLLCRSGSKGLVRVDGPDHPFAQIVVSFLEGSQTWATIGESAASNKNLDRYTGVLVEARRADNSLDALKSGTLIYPDGSRVPLAISRDGLAFRDKVKAGSVTLEAVSETRSFSEGLFLPEGGARALQVKAGPLIETVARTSEEDAELPLVGRTAFRIVGRRFDSVTPIKAWLLGMDGGTIPLNVTSADAWALEATLPDVARNSYELWVETSEGKTSARIFVDKYREAVGPLSLVATRD